MDADWIYGKRNVDLDQVKELKVKLPLRFHVKLHSLKLLRGKTMSGAVAEALEAYFGKPEHTPDGPMTIAPLAAPELRSE